MGHNSYKQNNIKSVSRIMKTQLSTLTIVSMMLSVFIFAPEIARATEGDFARATNGNLMATEIKRSCASLHSYCGTTIQCCGSMSCEYFIPFSTSRQCVND